MKLGRLLRSVTVAAALTVTGTAGLVAVPTAANAATIFASIDVSSNGAAVGSVGGIGGSYTSVLTATGGGTCALLNAPSVIADADTGSGNPSTTSTEGGCTLFNATVEYTLTYTSVLGVTGVFYRTCVWELGTQICSPRGVSL